MLCVIPSTEVSMSSPQHQYHTQFQEEMEPSVCWAVLPQLTLQPTETMLDAVGSVLVLKCHYFPPLLIVQRGCTAETTSTAVFKQVNLTQNSQRSL